MVGHDPTSYVSWSFVLLVGPPMLNRSKGRGQMKCDPVGMRADNPLSQNHIITETTSRATLPNPGDAVATRHNRRCCGNPSQQDRAHGTWGPNPAGCSQVDKATSTPPKNSIKIGNWNVQTLYISGNIMEAAREMTSRNNHQHCGAQLRKKKKRQIGNHGMRSGL